VARTALQEVRAAVAGYRRPTLAGELRGAREILAAAGIGFQYQGESFDLPPDVEAVLAWTVREGVINVIRHSRARRCTVELVLGQGEAGIEVRDDGRGPESGATAPLPETGGGSGLQGLAERAGAIGGRFATGPRPGGGFRVSVIVPLAAEGAAAKATEERGTLQAGSSVRP
jgi:two-component system sensor histidine kinase DesK